MKKIIRTSALVFFVTSISALADHTNSIALPAAPALPDASASLLRVLGALALVLGLFLGGVWFFKNGKMFSARRGAAPKLNLLETRSLGQRQAICVVGYEKQRFLLATSPNGIEFLTHLPDSENVEPEPVAAAPSFAQALSQVLKKK
jgi:flagellar biogenesis protein FliO